MNGRRTRHQSIVVTVYDVSVIGLLPNRTMPVVLISEPARRESRRTLALGNARR